MDTLRRLVLATQNAGKVDEINALLADLTLDLLPASEIDDPPAVEEDQPTLAGNAQKKAEAYHAHTGLPALADDTGLEVDALDGRPGVRTARFAGPDATPDDNCQLLLDTLADVAERTARFRTVVAFVEEGNIRHFEGVCEGTIIRERRGDGGFGYDPIFRPEGRDQTFAEMPATAKNAISHRRRAIEQFSDYLHARLSDRAADA
jgi:XTP/dITP diphosphohydrolase